MEPNILLLCLEISFLIILVGFLVFKMVMCSYWRIANLPTSLSKSKSQAVKVNLILNENLVGLFQSTLFEKENGHNCRVRGIKTYTQLDDDEYIANGVFERRILQKSLSKIASFPTTFLYWRSRLLLRYANETSTNENIRNNPWPVLKGSYSCSTCASMLWFRPGTTANISKRTFRYSFRSLIGHFSMTLYWVFDNSLIALDIF